MKREVADVDGAFSETLSVKPDHDGRLQMRDFKTAFETLPDEQREALILVGVEGFSYEEAAVTAGVAIGTIKSRVNRARAALTDLMGLDGDHPLEMTDKATSSVLNRDIVLEN
jgi:RNA polymerase sigma-70 factor (ECF subfamily)